MSTGDFQRVKKIYTEFSRKGYMDIWAVYLGSPSRPYGESQLTGKKLDKVERVDMNQWIDITLLHTCQDM